MVLDKLNIYIYIYIYIYIFGLMIKVMDDTNNGTKTLRPNVNQSKN